jgi:hypothetical protein
VIKVIGLLGYSELCALTGVAAIKDKRGKKHPAEKILEIKKFLNLIDFPICFQYIAISKKQASRSTTAQTRLIT